MSISEQLIELGFAGKLQEDLSFIIEDENDFDEFLLFCSSKEKESNMRIVKDYRGIMFKKDLIDKKEFIECYKCSDIKGRHKLCEGFTKRKIRVDTIELMDYYLDTDKTDLSTVYDNTLENINLPFKRILTASLF